MSKGSGRRPRQISREEEELRWDFLDGRVDRDEFERRFLGLKDAGKIIRGGRVIGAKQ